MNWIQACQWWAMMFLVVGLCGCGATEKAQVFNRDARVQADVVVKDATMLATTYLSDSREGWSDSFNVQDQFAIYKAAAEGKKPDEMVEILKANQQLREKKMSSFDRCVPVLICLCQMWAIAQGNSDVFTCLVAVNEDTGAQIFQQLREGFAGIGAKIEGAEKDKKEKLETMPTPEKKGVGASAPIKTEGEKP